MHASFVKLWVISLFICILQLTGKSSFVQDLFYQNDSDRKGPSKYRDCQEKTQSIINIRKMSFADFDMLED